MEQRTIFLGNFEKAVRFVYQAEKAKAQILLINGTSIVNGKSLLGVISLNLSEPITMLINGDDRSKDEAIHTLGNYFQSSQI